MSSLLADRNPRLRLVSVGAALLFGGAIYSQARVQVLGSSDIRDRAKASKRFIVSTTEEPRRGQILSADGKVLARDHGVYALHMNYAKVPRTQGFYLDLGQAAGMSAGEIRELMERSQGDVVWPASLSAEERRKVLAVKTKWRADGLSADPTGERFYPMGMAASSLVGMVGKDGSRKGVELSLADALSGVAGKSTGLVDRTGAYLPMRMEDESTPRIDGSDVVLTIDSMLQEVAFQSIRRAVVSNKAKAGVAIVIEPKTGRVLAMANWPTYDPRNGQGPDGKPADFNPSIQDYWEPGSTMKILTEAKAIEDRKVSAGWTWNCTGALKKGPYRIQCDLHHGSRSHGTVDLEKAIAVSCNVSAAQWACLIGYDPYRQFLDDLGFLAKPDLDLPNVKAGQVFPEEVAKTLQLMCWGFGQSMDVTPLSLAAGFTSLGNGGLWMQPQLIRSVGGVEREPVQGKKVFSPETSSQMMRYMESVFESERGTGKTLRIPGYRMAGKTGTAQRMGRGGGNVSNFVGFLPAEDPKAMILVMVDRPSGGAIYGAQVAGPAYLELARAVIRRLDLRPSSGTPEHVGVTSKTDAETMPR